MFLLFFFFFSNSTFVVVLEFCFSGRGLGIRETWEESEEMGKADMEMGGMRDNEAV